MIVEPRDKSPGRISRTRSGQISPSVEDDNSKRSTRSAKPKNQISDTQNGALYVHYFLYFSINKYRFFLTGN